MFKRGGCVIRNSRVSRAVQFPLVIAGDNTIFPVGTGPGTDGLRISSAQQRWQLLASKLIPLSRSFDWVDQSVWVHSVMAQDMSKKDFGSTECWIHWWIYASGGAVWSPDEAVQFRRVDDWDSMRPRLREQQNLITRHNRWVIKRWWVDSRRSYS